jgi:hypothetical protein
MSGLDFEWTGLNCADWSLDSCLHEVVGEWVKVLCCVPLGEWEAMCGVCVAVDGVIEGFRGCGYGPEEVLGYEWFKDLG